MVGASVVEFLAEKLGSVLREKLKEEVSLIVTFREEFESIYYELAHIKSMLNDAGEQTNSQSLTNWLQNLRDVLTDAMDLVEECEEADNAQISILQHQIFQHPMGRKIITLDQMRRQFMFRHQKGREIKELKKRIDKINGTGNQYLTYLKSFVDVKPSSGHERENSSSLDENHQIVGIDADIDVITKELFKENGPGVIAVWGMGGLGKTTMIRQLFNSKKVQNGFQHRVWLTVSGKYKIDHLLHDIAQKINLPKDEITDVSIESLRVRIDRCLRGEGEIKNVEQEKASVFVRVHRYLTNSKKPSLFVLDDVWDENVLQKIGLDWGNPKNKYKVVVTTRDKGVSSAIGAHYTHEMKYLSDEESLKLFCIYAFADGKLPDHLESFRPDILQKCTRLPKAVEEIAKSMAGVSMIDSHWEMALSDVDKEDIIEKHVMPTLRSSYNALPHDLKACFHYFASFPPNTKIKSECLVYAWLANFRDFLPSGVDGLDIAWSYVDQLVGRCLIQASEFGVDGRVKYCQMQEFFHGLALSESHKEAKCVLKWKERLRDFPVQECKNARRISLAKTHIPRIKDAIKCPELRILSLRDNTRLTSISARFFDKLKYLGALDLSKTGIKSLPSSIGNLKRVKFLNLSRTNIEELPKSLSDLGSLLFLDVSDCADLRRLHSGIGRHTDMHYLDVSGCKNLESLPSGLSKLRSLRTLKLKEVVFNRKPAADAFGWTGFKDFTDMQQLSVTFNSETSLSEGFLSLQTWERMGNLRVLSLQYLSSTDECCTLPLSPAGMQRIERLRLQRLLVPPPASTFWKYHLQNLKQLILEDDDRSAGSYYKGIENIPNLKKLALFRNKKCSNFPKKFGESNAFPKLEELIIDDFKNLENFPSLQKNTMPLLRYLKITNCSQMKDMPNGLDKLKSLEKIRLDTALLKRNRFPRIVNASGSLIYYMLQRKGYPQILDDRGIPISHITFEETEEGTLGSSKWTIT